MRNFCRRSCDRGAEPDLSVGRTDEILCWAAAMRPILQTARDLGEVPRREEVFEGLDGRPQFHLRFRADDTVYDVRRLIARVVAQAPEEYNDLFEPFPAHEMLSLTREYEEAVRLSNPNARGVSDRRDHLVHAVRSSIPPYGFFPSIRWALQWYFPYRVSEEDIERFGLRADDTPDSIRRALYAFERDPEVAEVIGRPLSYDSMDRRPFMGV